MNDQNKKQDLDWELLSAKAAPSKDKRIYQLLPKIEAALAADVSHANILEHLRAGGLQMSFRHYESSLARARARARAEIDKFEIENTRKRRPANKQQFSAPFEHEARSGAARIAANPLAQPSTGSKSDLALDIRPTEKPQLDRLWGAQDRAPEQEDPSSSTDNPQTKE